MVLLSPVVPSTIPFTGMCRHSAPAAAGRCCFGMQPVSPATDQAAGEACSKAGQEGAVQWHAGVRDARDQEQLLGHALSRLCMVKVDQREADYKPAEVVPCRGLQGSEMPEDNSAVWGIT